MNTTRDKRERKPTKFFGHTVDINSALKIEKNPQKSKINNTPKVSKKMDSKTTTTTTPKSSTRRISERKSVSKRKTTTTTTKKKARPPSVKEPKINNPREALDKALIRLLPSSVQEALPLPCREYQFEDIYNFVQRKLLEGQGGCMYISGVPGTGKTATIREVKAKLCQNEELPLFKFIEINGMELEEPRQFFSHFLSKLDGTKKKSNKLAADILAERFTDPSIEKELVVLFIDELDPLRTKKQEVLYQIFDWPNRQDSRLIVLAVANSMDLPERFLLNRVSSRLGLTRLQFQPYAHEELARIVKTKLGDLNGFEVFGPDTLQLICRKVSAVSGDARKVLGMSRRAIEKAIEDKCDNVTMNHVDKTVKEMFCSLKMNRIKKSSEQEKIFFRALLENYRSSGLEVFQFIEIYNTHVDICRTEGLFIPNTTELTLLAGNLHMSHLIYLELSPSHLYRRIILNVSPADLELGLKLA